ncbi:MAG: sigma-70 family RNA polymerase sigma factor [Rubrivivax sp.]|nr:sigma-70 family RNA polymerase sigma factor [Rubrivivax sp.]
MADLSQEDDDAALVERCRRGDASAWTTLVKRYQRLVYAIVTRAGFDDHGAADVFQTVFSRLVEHLPRLAQPERLQAWIVTTAKREALRAREIGRRTVSMSRDEDDDMPGLEDTVADDAPLAEEQLSELQQLHRLRLGLDRLDQRCRTLLLLVFRDEDEKLGYDEVARRMDMPAGSLGPTRARCLGKLRKLVEGA